MIRGTLHPATMLSHTIRPLIGPIPPIVGILSRDIGVAVFLGPYALQHEPGVMTAKGEGLGDSHVDFMRLH